jgi:hypothetical protein
VSAPGVPPTRTQTSHGRQTRQSAQQKQVQPQKAHQLQKMSPVRQEIQSQPDENSEE